MQYGEVDMVIIGIDWIMVIGDVCNKIGIYLKVFVVKDNNVLFYVGFFFFIIDFILLDGVRDILIEECGGDEVSYIIGKMVFGVIEIVNIVVEGLDVGNLVFDVMLVCLVIGFIIECGVLVLNCQVIVVVFFECVKISV